MYVLGIVLSISSRVTGCLARWLQDVTAAIVAIGKTRFALSVPAGDLVTRNRLCPIACLLPMRKQASEKIMCQLCVKKLEPTYLPLNHAIVCLTALPFTRGQEALQARVTERSSSLLKRSAPLQTDLVWFAFLSVLLAAARSLPRCGESAQWELVLTVLILCHMTREGALTLEITFAVESSLS